MFISSSNTRTFLPAVFSGLFAVVTIFSCKIGLLGKYIGSFISAYISAMGVLLLEEEGEEEMSGISAAVQAAILHIPCMMQPWGKPNSLAVNA